MFTRMFIPVGLVDVMIRKSKRSVLFVDVPSKFIAVAKFKVFFKSRNQTEIKIYDRSGDFAMLVLISMMSVSVHIQLNYRIQQNHRI